MRYDIEADWVLLLTCNYRCSYCFIDEASLGGKIRRLGTPAQWREGFARTGRTWLLHMTGGEPSVHPDFLALAQGLSQDHYLSLNSNLTHAQMDAFADTVDPTRVHYVNASLHHDERVARGGLEAFIVRAQRLQQRGFRVMVSQVADPAILPRLEGIMDAFASHGLHVFPKALREPYRGRLYPQAYTAAERERIAALTARARRSAQGLWQALGEAPTIDLFHEERHLEARSYHGRSCGAGPRFVQIDETGRVKRCGSPVSYGNLLLGNVVLPTEERRCHTTYCPYYCEKYAAPRPDAAGGIVAAIPRDPDSKELAP